jgi:hypothetical protein
VTLNAWVTVHDVARALPDIPLLRERCRAYAMLDAIMCPEWEDRYYSFDSQWSAGEELASMRTGTGDLWSIVFSAAGAFVRGFDHGSPMSPARNGGRLWPGLVESVPAEFADCVTEPAFSYGDVLEATVCLWRRTGDDRWRAGDVRFPSGDDPDGATNLFETLVEGSYQEFAEDYYERPLDADAVRAVLDLRPLTADLVRRLNPALALVDLAGDLAEIGYPVGR